MSKQNNKQEIAIKLSGVKKQYKLGQIGGGTLTADLQSWWARIRGKEDPNSMIGSNQRLIGQKFMALNGIDLTIYKGEAVGIIGGNGAGKSTMLKLLSRVTAPTDGEIDIYGRIASMLEVGTGFNGELTGRENVYMNGAILGMTKEEIDAKMEDIIEFSEVREFIDTPVKRYSSGMYVKLAFSVAAHLDSEIMIMDEVLAVGDMAFQKKCLDKMRDAAKKEGRTVLYVSHNMNTIRQLCDRCIVLGKGKVIFEGDVEEGIRQYLGYSASYQSKIDLSKLTRETSFSNSPFTMNSFNVVNSDDSIFSVGDNLIFNLEYSSTNSLKDLQFRAIIKSTDGFPIAMFSTNQSTSINDGETSAVQLSVDISNIVPGKYTLSLVVYEVSEFGTDINRDVLRDFYSFEIITKTGFNNNMPWQQRYWGHTYGNPISIAPIDIISSNK